MITIKQFEDAVAAALSIVMPDADIDVYSGELEDDEQIIQTINTLPAIRFGYAGGTIERRGSNSKWRNATLSLFICARALHDDGSDMGIYTMLETVIDTLHDKQLGLSSITPCEVTDEASFYNSSDICVYVSNVKSQLPR